MFFSYSQAATHHFSLECSYPLMLNYYTPRGQMIFADSVQVCGQQQTRRYDFECHKELFYIKERGGCVIMVTLSPIAKGIRSLLFDYSLTVKQGVLKELLLRHHNGPPSLPDTRLWGDLFHTGLIIVSMCVCVSLIGFACFFVLHSCVYVRVFFHAYVCASVWKRICMCVYMITSEIETLLCARH